MTLQTQHTTKSGRPFTIRMATPSDAGALLNLKLDYLTNTHSIPLFVDEYTNTVDDERQLIQRLIDEDNSYLLVAESEGQLVGNADLNGNQRRKLYHTAMYGIGIATAWQSQGIGYALTSTMVDLAIENPCLDIVLLDVYEDNLAGLKIYEKNGFTVCGRIPDFFRQGDVSIANIRMVRNTKTLNHL